MNKKLLIVYTLFFLPISLQAHCQLPCGIYHDDLRFAAFEEDVQTINKALTVINQSDSTAKGQNQMVRAVNLKDTYADRITQTIVEYFLQQRISQDHTNFSQLLETSFQIMKLTTKVKASVSNSDVDQLSELLQKFKSLYQNSQ